MNVCLNQVGSEQCSKHNLRKAFMNFKIILASTVTCQGFPSVKGQVLPAPRAGREVAHGRRSGCKI